MERQLRRGLWRLAKDRVGFDDAQMRQLESTTQRYDQRRRALAQEERTVRQSLRQQILADRSADQTAVSTALDRLHELQRQRFELQAEEQKEFSTFMTPLQRAKYAALQEQVRRRLEDLRRARPDTSTVGVSAP
jgi:Spy/CpxP family protein refolding chaperone